MQNHPVDSFGLLKAELADLESRAETLRAAIIAMGTGAHEGDLYRATVSVSERKAVDWKAIAAKLEPSHQLVTAHTTVTPTTTVRVVARNGKAA